jgi:methyl-accepting chemotaxis protein
MPESGITYLLIANFIGVVVIAVHISDIKRLTRNYSPLSIEEITEKIRDMIDELSINQHLESIDRHLDELRRQLTSIDDGIDRIKDRLHITKDTIDNDTIASTLQELQSVLDSTASLIENLEDENQGLAAQKSKSPSSG